MSSGKTEGRLPRRSSVLKTSSFIVHLFLPFPLFHRGASRNLYARFRNLHRQWPTVRRVNRTLPRAFKKACKITHQQAKEKLPFTSIDDLAPNAGRQQFNSVPNSPPRANIEREDRAGNDECSRKSSTKRKEERREEKGLSGHSSSFVRRNGEKPGIFAE